MTNPEYDAVVKVHVVANDVRKSAPADRTANAFTVAATATPALLLSHAPARVRATLTVCGNAGDTALICGKGDGSNVTPSGALIQPGQVLIITATNELYLVAKTGVSVQVGVLAEYKERTS